MSDKFPYSITIHFEREEPISPEEAKALMERIGVPLTERVTYFVFEPEYEWNEVANLIEEGMSEPGRLDHAELALTTAECIWGQTPDSVRLSTRISLIRMLGK